MNIDTKKVTTLINGVGSPETLVADWITGNVYFYDNRQKTSIKVFYQFSRKSFIHKVNFNFDYFRRVILMLVNVRFWCVSMFLTKGFLL